METRRTNATRRETAAAAAAAKRAPNVTTGEGNGRQEAGLVARVGFAPIVRVDAARREIELCATSEALDSYGTVFDYTASKDAFTRWIGNVREMHERRAVGSRVSVRCDDAARKVYVCVRISRGAQDTWEKVLDGTLRGASIGASNVTWEQQARRISGRERLLNVATRYDLVELSLVDNPSNPDAMGISIVRDAVPDAAVLDDLPPQRQEDLTPDPTPRGERGATSVREAAEGEDRARPSGQDSTMASDDSNAHGLDTEPPVSARFSPRRGEAGSGVSPSTQDSALESRDDPNAPPEVRIARQAAAHGWAAIGGNRGEKVPAHEANGLKLALSGSERLQSPSPCSGALGPSVSSGGAVARTRGPFSTNPEGHPDVGVPARAEERPTSALGMRQGGNAHERFHAAARGILMGCGCPLCEGALAALGETDATDGEAYARALRDGGVVSAPRDAAIARALASGLSASVARMERMDEHVRGLGDLLQLAVSQMTGAGSDLRRRVEALEAQPAPGGPAAFAFDKSLALSPAGGQRNQPGPVDQFRALESLAGKLTDPQAQIAVAAELIRLQRGE